MRPSPRIVLAAFAVMGAFAAPAYASCGSATTAEAPRRARADAALVARILQQANQSLGQGDFNDACTKYRMVLSVDETNADARLGLGEGALGEGDYLSARAHFQAVADAQAQNARAQQGVGLSYLLAGDPAGADPYLHRAVEADASLWRSWNALGIIADSRSDWAAADAAWAGAIAAAPDQADIYNNEGMSMLQRGNAAAARAAFEQALQRDPTLQTAASNRRVALAMLGQYDQALAGVSERDLPAAMNNVAVVAARRGDRAVADRLLAAAITASPRYYEIAVRNREALNQPQPTIATTRRRQ